MKLEFVCVGSDGERHQGGEGCPQRSPHVVLMCVNV
jgi:hypothetical protein